MIRLDRAQVPVPAELLESPTSPAAIELAAVVKFYGKGSNKNKPYKYAVYSLDPVKKAVEQLTLRKCAYCESKYAATAPVDVEHFRPKGGVAVGKKVVKPGYYWLAMSWHNLLPSCIDCNRRRTHEYRAGKKLTGKANYFPLANETARAKKPGEETGEDPLLLDPTRDDPAQHLVFDAEGTVRPASAPGGGVSRKAATSIEIYGLMRPVLCDFRRDRAIEIKAQIQRVKDAALNEQEFPGVARFKTVFRQELQLLKQMMHPAQPYSAMARQMIEAFIRTEPW